MSAGRIHRVLGTVVAIAATGLLVACGGGGGGGSSPPPPPPPPPPPAATVTISGKITYDFVPHRVAGPPFGLDYSQTEPRPARLVTVQFIATGNPPVTNMTDLNGDYSLNVPANRTGFIRVLAQSTQAGTPGWTFSVVDNTNNNSVYTLDGAELSSGAANSVRDLHAPSGWTGTGYGATRAAAPFAILDSVYTAAAYIVAADPSIVFPPLNLHWSPDNRSAFGTDGEPDPAMGDIGTSHYSPNSATIGIYLLGEENLDSDEYDRHVIVHEFGHYLEHRFGRSENLGGPHGRGDRLDPRVAFSEGWATGFAGLAVDNPNYRDAGGNQQSGATGFNIEQPPSQSANPTPGWYSEQSVWELVYDLVDTANDGSDINIAYPFADIWTVMKGAMTTTPALPNIFPFWRAIKLAHPADEIALDQLAASQAMASVTDDYGSGETNDAGSADVLPIYTPIAVNQTVNLCSTDEFTGPQTGAVNKLSSRRFLRFRSLNSGTVTVTITATSIPPGEYADPDFIVHWDQLGILANGAPSAACQDNALGIGIPSSCVEVSDDIPVTVDDYVLEIYEWTNTNDTDDPDFPPIGRTCFDVLVTQP